MLIQNYGLHWHRDEMDWGTPGPGGSGSLLGRPVRRKRTPEVDFREQQGVYVLYDETFKIIYVGQTGVGNQRLFRRLRQHKRDHLAQRWSRFSWFGILPVLNGELDPEVEREPPKVKHILEHIEAILIATVEPPLNLQRGRFGTSVEQYIQHIPGEDEPEEIEEEE